MITEVFLPQLTSTMEEGAVVNWLKPEGTPVKAGEPLVEIETDKAVMEVESPADGVLLKILVGAGETRPVLTTIGLVGDPADNVSQFKPSQGPAATSAGKAGAAQAAAEAPAGRRGPDAAPAGRTPVSPRARRLAAELGVDLAGVKGTGPDGVVVEKDVRRAAETKSGAAPARGAVALTGMRKAVASMMTRSKQEIPHFYLTSEIDMAACARLLAELCPAYAAQGVKLTYTTLVVKAAALALRKVPPLNAYCTADGIQALPDINVGVAAAAREGIVVPVVHHTDRRPLAELARMVQDMAERARSGALPADAFTGRTFTVSSLGAFPVTHFAAIINPPEVGILAVGRVQDVVVAHEGKMGIRPQLLVTLSCDHRAVDGVVGATFLRELIGLLQEPATLV